MKVFISWSGELSKRVAELLKSWIEDVLQGTDVWISTEDIEKGSLWFTEVTNQLAETGVGIVCLTRDNMNTPWILFEAGAFAKGLTKNRVCPLLIDLSPSDLVAPLSQFNATLPNREDMLKLVKTINTQRDQSSLSDERVGKAFERWWDEFEGKFKEITKEHKPRKEISRRPPEDMIEEILQTTRAIQRELQTDGGQPSLPLGAHNTLLGAPERDLLRHIERSYRRRRRDSDILPSSSESNDFRDTLEQMLKEHYEEDKT